MVTSPVTDEKGTHDIASPVSESRIKKFWRKSPAAMAASIRWNILNFIQICIFKLRFDLITWWPKGNVPIFVAYYPDALPSFPDLTDLYRRWVRGNRINNNGDSSRFMALMLNLRQLQADNIEGDFAELGVWKGNSAALLADAAAKSGKKLYLFDTFSGFDRRDLIGIDHGQKLSFADTSIDFVRETVGHHEITTYLQGFFPDSITEEVRQRTFALVHIDCDLYEPMKEALEFFYQRMPKGGMLILHDYSSGIWAGAARAIDEFSRAKGEYLALWPDKSGTAMIRKSR